MIFACTLYAIYAVGLRKKPKISALPLLTFFAYIAFLGSLPGFIYETYSNQLILPGQKGFIILGVIIIFPSFLAQIFFMKGVEKIGPSRTLLIFGLQPSLLINEESRNFLGFPSGLESSKDSSPW